MPLTACLDCGELVSRPRNGRCEAHAKSTVNARKRKPSPVRSSREWRGLSMRMRADQPFCSVCGTQGSERNPLTVDHLIPLAAGGELLPDEDGLQVVCRRHNSQAGVRPHGPGKYRV